MCLHEGGSRKEQLTELGPCGAHFVVGTPKRIHDMANKDQLSLLRVTYLILDGADRMLTAGLQEEVVGLAAWVRPEHQTAIFSATWPRPLHELASRLCFAGGDPVRFAAKEKAAKGKLAVARAPVVPAPQKKAPRAPAGAEAVVGEADAGYDEPEAGADAAENEADAGDDGAQEDEAGAGDGGDGVVVQDETNCGDFWEE